jgi:hypothetical protein
MRPVVGRVVLGDALAGVALDQMVMEEELAGVGPRTVAAGGMVTMARGPVGAARVRAILTRNAGREATARVGDGAESMAKEGKARLPIALFSLATPTLARA